MRKQIGMWSAFILLSTASMVAHSQNGGGSTIRNGKELPITPPLVNGEKRLNIPIDPPGSVQLPGGHLDSSATARLQPGSPTIIEMELSKIILDARKRISELEGNYEKLENRIAALERSK